MWSKSCIEIIGLDLVPEFLWTLFVLLFVNSISFLISSLDIFWISIKKCFFLPERCWIQIVAFHQILISSSKIYSFDLSSIAILPLTLKYHMHQLVHPLHEIQYALHLLTSSKIIMHTCASISGCYSFVFMKASHMISLQIQVCNRHLLVRLKSQTFQKV